MNQNLKGCFRDDLCKLYFFLFTFQLQRYFVHFENFLQKLKICIFKVKINKDECYFCLGRCSTKNCHKVSKLQSSQKHLKRDGWCQIYRWFLICSRDSLSLVIPNNKMLEHWRLKLTFIAMLWWICEKDCNL